MLINFEHRNQIPVKFLFIFVTNIKFYRIKSQFEIHYKLGRSCRIRDRNIINEPHKTHKELINLETQYGNIKGSATDNTGEQKP